MGITHFSTLATAKGLLEFPGLAEHISSRRLFVALLPLNVHDLGELEISRVSGEQAGGCRGGAGQADLGVDVEHALRAAWRPDDRCAVCLVVLEVVTGQGTNEVVLSAGLEWG